MEKLLNMSKDNKEEQFFTNEVLDITANLSRLKLTKDDQEFLRNGLQEILTHFETMASVTIKKGSGNDTLFQGNELRPDKAIESAKQWQSASCQNLLNSAPDSEDDHIVVPYVL